MSRKITKREALYKITQFGRCEERSLIEAHRHHEAYQIEHARNRMLYALVDDGIKGVRELLPLMTGAAEERDPAAYVMDEQTRNLLAEFVQTF